MKYLKIFLRDIIKRPSLYFFIFLAVFTFDRHHRYENYADSRYGPFYSDVLEYYTFLPEYFLEYKQVDGINFQTNKRTIGMAIMYAPAFFTGHLIAHYGAYPETGYSLPYQKCVRWGSILYCVLGLFLCRKSLLRFFEEPVVAISLACVFFGTNLFYYTFSAGEYSHAYLFFLNSVVIYFTLKWILDKKAGSLLFIGLTAGMITLIRPTGILVLLFPLLFNIGSVKDLRARIMLVFNKKTITFFTLVLFMLPLVVQMCTWKIYKGQYIHYSYGEERFFFNDPQIINFLFSFRKGWLLYTPMMIFSLFGIVLSLKRFREFSLFLVVFFVLNVYILSSWWDWAYGGSFGCRVLVESYAFMIFPFAIFVNYIWNPGLSRPFYRIATRLTFILIFYLLVELNLFQIWQYKYGRIHWNGMNRKTYQYVFLRDDVSSLEMVYLDTQWSVPDPKQMIKGLRDK